MEVDRDRWGCGTEMLNNERNARKEFIWKKKTMKNFRSLVEEGIVGNEWSKKMYLKTMWRRLRTMKKRIHLVILHWHYNKSGDSRHCNALVKIGNDIGEGFLDIQSDVKKNVRRNIFDVQAARGGEYTSSDISMPDVDTVSKKHEPQRPPIGIGKR